jgi:hypothetical protein
MSRTHPGGKQAAWIRVQLESSAGVCANRWNMRDPPHLRQLRRTLARVAVVPVGAAPAVCPQLHMSHAGLHLTGWRPLHCCPAGPPLTQPGPGQSQGPWPAPVCSGGGGAVVVK